MTDRRRLAIALLALASLGYGAVLVLSLFGTIYLTGMERPIGTIEQVIFGALSLESAFFAWALAKNRQVAEAAVIGIIVFVTAAAGMWARQPSLALGIALTGAVPLLLVYKEVTAAARTARWNQ